MGVLADYCNQLGGDESGVKSMTRVDVVAADIVDRQLHLSVRAERTDHLGNFLEEIAEVYSIAVSGLPQRLVEFRRYLDARVKIVEQHSNLLGGAGLAALDNSHARHA